MNGSVGVWNSIGAWMYRHPATVYVCIILLQVIKNGFMLQPNFDVAVTKIALSPFQSFDEYPPGARYVTSSWLMPALLYFLRVSSETVMIWLHVAAAFGYYVVTFLNIKRFVPEDSRLTAVVILGLLPSTASAFNWLGYDTVVLLLISLLIASSSSIALSFTVAVALGMQHFEIATVSLVCWFTVSRGILGTFRLRKLTFFCAVGLGLLVGRVVVGIILTGNQASAEMDRWDIGRQLYRRALADFALTPVAVLWSVLGLSGIYLSAMMFKRIHSPMWLVVGFSIPWIVAGSTLDSSRVGAVSVTLAVMAAVMSSPQTLQRIGTGSLLATIGLFLLVPRVWIWEGNYVPSCFAANVQSVVSRFTTISPLTESDCRLFWRDS